MVETRRGFLKRSVLLGAGLSAGGVLYTFIEAKVCRLCRVDVQIPNLPAAFVGTTVALITDVHHGPYLSRAFVEDVVAMTNAAQPDLVCLCGDYVQTDRRYIEPCIGALAELAAPFGVFAVLGNHDHWEGAKETRSCLAAAGIADFTNTGTWLVRSGERLRLGGVGDLWEDEQNLARALGDATERDATLVMSHNPDFVEEIEDPRVGLVLSGHTHGGQLSIPLLGAPVLPSRYGQKYAQGLVRTEVTQVYVSRGVGTITPPLRFNCPPEVVLLRLAAAVPARTTVEG